MFEFIEVEGDDTNSQILYQEVSKEIPKEQKLTYLDLKTIEPNKRLIKSINKNILFKYRFIPLFLNKQGQKPLLPKHLKKMYWEMISGNKEDTIYIGIVNPYNQQALNIIRTITKFNVVAVPIENNDLEKYFNLLFKNKLETKETLKKSKDIFSIIRENILYIIAILFVISLLMLAKYLIDI